MVWLFMKGGTGTVQGEKATRIHRARKQKFEEK